MPPQENYHPADILLKREVAYEGEVYSPIRIESILSDYQLRHETDLRKFEDLSRAYDRLAREMSGELGDQKRLSELVGGLFVPARSAASLHALLRRLPLMGGLLPAPDLQALLGEKVELAQRRVQEVGNYLDALQNDIKNLQDDIRRLNEKTVQAARNMEKASAHILELEDMRRKIELALAALPDQRSSQAREAAARISEVKRAIWEHGARLRLYANAEDRITAIVGMNNNFLEIMTSLHGNMTALYEAGNEVLNELHGNLSGLASLSKAGTLSVEMHRSMDSLKESVNKLVRLASETSLYLTQNVGQLTSSMKIYDKETELLVQCNLEAEREIREERVDDTIALARLERDRRETRGQSS